MAFFPPSGFTRAMSGVPEGDYRLLNTETTISLARAASPRSLHQLPRATFWITHLTIRLRLAL
jgi:hypothetical protein